MRSVLSGRFRACIVACVTAVAAVAAQAEERACFGAASFGGPIGELRLMRVASPGPRVHFIGDKYLETGKGCPSADKSCEQKSFLVPGDEVIANAPEGDFACASYRGAKGPESTGYLPLKALEPVQLPAAKLADWAGHWQRAEADIRITVAGGRLKVAGDATWGAGDPQRVKNGGVHIGEIAGEATPSGNLLGLGDGYDGTGPLDSDNAFDCLARLRLFGRFLVVEDNGACGGANVRFNGIYLK